MINVDSSVHDPLLTARQAARLLDVKLATLYAYASRGFVRSVPSGKGKARLYPRSEVLRLRARHDARAGHGPVAAGALRWGEPVLDTAITAVGPRGPAYRGHLAVDLASAGATFEEVAELLFTGSLGAGGAWVADRAALRALGRLPVAGAHAFDALALLVPVAARLDPDRLARSTGAEHARARRLVATMVGALALAGGRGAGDGTSIASALAAALGATASAPAVRLVDRALVLLADHELNASSFAARVTASTGADLHACVASALGALSGPRHGGETDRVAAVLAEARRPRAIVEVVRGRVERGEEVPGFGHPLYPEGDPRTPPLLEAARRHAPSRVAPILALVDAVAALRGLAPTVDVGLVAVALALGLPPRAAAALFAIGRAAGWVAHALEQREAGFLLRPRARYVGAQPLRGDERATAAGAKP